MTLANRALILTIVGKVLFGCNSIRQDYVVTHENSQTHSGIYVPVQSEWSLENLRPHEDIVLIDGIGTDVSVDMSASGVGAYEILLIHDDKQTEPFEIEIFASGQDDVATFVTPSWSIKARGLTEEVVVSLYSIKKTKSGKTTARTLLKQFTRKYQLVCNRNEFWLSLILKRMLHYCRFV